MAPADPLDATTRPAQGGLMIQSLTLENFQSHKSSKLDFSPGINVIVGPSDSGKSAILRALKWAAWNTPSGEAFRSNWGGTTTVDLDTDTDSIIRAKDSKGNSYRLNKTVFKAFGAGTPPDEIVAALNLNEINIQQQLDRPFLLDDSPGKVAQHFNAVAHLDSIDRGLQNVQKWLREVDRKIKSEEEQVLSLTEDLIKYAGLEKIEVKISVVETLVEQKESAGRKMGRISRLIKGIESGEEEAKKHTEILKHEVAVSLVLNTVKAKNELEGKIAVLHDLSRTIKGLQNQSKELESQIIFESRVDDALKAVKKWKKADSDYLGLKFMITSWKKEEIKAEKQLKEIVKMEKEFHDIFPDICPLCGQEVK